MWRKGENKSVIQDVSKRQHMQDENVLKEMQNRKCKYLEEILQRSVEDKTTNI